MFCKSGQWDIFHRIRGCSRPKPDTKPRAERFHHGVTRGASAPVGAVGFDDTKLLAVVSSQNEYPAVGAREGADHVEDVPSMTTRSKDDLFEILSSTRRRRIIYYLAQEGPQLTLNQLATKIAAVETDTPEADITSDERQRVYISLYQTHLPKLEAASIVAYDDEERTVSLTDDIRDNGFFWMDVGPESKRPWHHYYGVLAVVGWLLVGGVALSIPPAAALGWAGVATLVTLGLTLLVAAHQVTVRTEPTERVSGYELLVE